MSIKSFFVSVGDFLKKIFGSASVQQTVKATMTVLTPVIVEIVSLALGPVAGGASEQILTDIQTDFATLSAVAQGVTSASPTSTLATLNAVVASLKANLNQLLTDADIKNSAKFATIETDVNFFLNEIGAIESAVGGQVTKSSAPAASSLSASLPPPVISAPVTSELETEAAAEHVAAIAKPAPLQAGIGSVAPAAHTVDNS